VRVGGGGRLEDRVERLWSEGWVVYMAFWMLERGHTVYPWHRHMVDITEKDHAANML
jgi:hypothetical protein